MNEAGNILVLIAGVIVSYLCAEAITSLVITALRLSGPAGLIAGMVIFALVFFAVIQALEKFTGTGFFRFGD